MLKLKLFNTLYDEGDVNVVVDTTLEGVMVPEHTGGKLTNFVLGTIPSPHLTANEEGIVAPLRFGTERFVCFFPWIAIRALVTRQAIVNFPPDEKSVKPQKPPDTGGPSLKLIK